MKIQIEDFVFYVVKHTRLIHKRINCAYLIEDRWDDWFKYSTLHSLVIFDAAGERHEIGSVKIGERDMSEDQRRPNLPQSFEFLADSFFSLGQSEDYYEILGKLPKELKNHIVDSLRDVVADL